jgi:chromosome segregation protein
MFLKSLSILGFKSFADRVRLDFGEGITAIVGPNGSGKSNIADAIQWVLGEQNVRTLRAENSTEVIFAGSAWRKPLGMAEVSLTVDNSDGQLPIDFAEVTVTRRLYRSGESEYLINKNPCRLKDIVELFMDTGLGRATYAILTQNEVDVVLSARPEDRRALFEEAAGIQKYRHRKREALRKLENTEANLTRVVDILAELGAQREPLRQQAEVAIRYHELVSRLREIEVAALWAQVLESERAREQAQHEQQSLHRQLLEVNAQLAECEALSQKLGQQIADAEAELDTLRALQQASLTAYERAESRRALIEQRLQNSRDNLRRLQEDLLENEHRYAEIQRQAQQWQERRLELEQRLQNIEQQRQVARERLRLAEHALQQAQQHYVERTQQVVRALAHLDGLRLRRTEAEQTIQALQNRFEEVVQNLREVEERVKAAQAHRDKTVAAAELALRETQRCENELQQAQVEVQRKQQELETRARENARLSARLQALLESEAAQEGLFSGVRAVLDAVARGQLTGTYLLVADALQPLEPYVTAVEVALGASAQDIITATEEEARLAIEWLKEHARGRATFLPLNLLRPSEPLPSLQQCMLLHQMQALEQEQTEQAKRLYELDNEIWEVQERLSPDTQQVSTHDEVSRFREQRDEAAAQLQEVEVMLGRQAEQQRALEHHRESLAQMQRELLQQRQAQQARMAELEANIAQEEKALEQTLEELRRIAQQRAQIEQDFFALREVRQNLLQQNLENSERLKELSAQQSALAQQAHELELALARIEMQRTQAVARLWEAYEVDVSRETPPDLSQFTPETASEINRLRREIRQMGNVNTGAAEEYQRLTERYEFLQKQRSDLEAAREDILQAIQEIDASTRDLFLQTFGAVQQAFQEVFARLFGGGKAQLQLTQPHNLLETGVEILVQPPGKRRQNLVLLSGGERALVAIALMFAFLQVKPSPFCVLDEVDAALDGSNVEKFADMLREYARHSQVIIITHNPVTIECADVWYGVTMQEQGVSRVISYRAPKEAVADVS